MKAVVVRKSIGIMPIFMLTSHALTRTVITYYKNIKCISITMMY